MALQEVVDGVLLDNERRALEFQLKALRVLHSVLDGQTLFQKPPDSAQNFNRLSGR
jgi:hypothetical protein